MGKSNSDNPLRQLTLDAFLGGHADSPEDAPPAEAKKATKSPTRRSRKRVGSPPGGSAESADGSAPAVYTVSELTDLLRAALKSAFPASITVVGEVSNLTRAASGHWYFTLKDSRNQVRCVMWRHEAARVRFDVADGQAVEVRGRIDIYGPRSNYQVQATGMRPQGMGELELAFRQLRDKLEKAGLFDRERKRPIPPYPFTIAVVTSRTGAAVRDVVRTLSRRWPVARLLLHPVAVQGDSAAGQIAEAIDAINADRQALGVDVIVVGRGGGSLEDLWAFNEEGVARAIDRSVVPVIAGVGHESDVTIAELVADLRAATPTAAAECAAPVLGDVLAGLGDVLGRLRSALAAEVSRGRDALGRQAGRGLFTDSAVILLAPRAQELDDLTDRLGRRMAERTHKTARELNVLEHTLNRYRPDRVLARAESRLVEQGRRLRYAVGRLADRKSQALSHESLTLSSVSPKARMGVLSERVLALAGRLTTSGKRLSSERRRMVEHLGARLAGCDYHAVLNRGFAIIRRADDGGVVDSTERIASGGRIRAELRDGELGGTIDEIARAKPRR